jgi:hypothetical protein
VQRINTKLQDSLTTLSQASPSAGPPPAAANGNSSSAGAAGDADATAPRGKIDKMSAEVVDSNPYSRLMALQRMGIVQDYEKIRQKTVSAACSRVSAVIAPPSLHDFAVCKQWQIEGCTGQPGQPNKQPGVQIWRQCLDGMLWCVMLWCVMLR